MCNKTPPHRESCVGSLHRFPPSTSKSTPRNSAWSSEMASYRFQFSCGRSCSASPQARAEHSLGLAPAGDVKEYTDDTVGLPSSTSAPLRFGNAVDGSGNLAFRWSNAVDEPKVYDFALTKAQVQNLFDTTKKSNGGGSGNIDG